MMGKFVYLDDLGGVTRETPEPSLGFGIVQLVMATQEIALERTNRLIEQVQQELEDIAFRRKVLELIETILVYKFANLSRQELEAMFGLDELKQTRYFQEVVQEAAAEAAAKARVEGKLESVPRLLQLGLSVEQIVLGLELDIEVVRRAAIEPNSDAPRNEGTEN